MRAGKEAAKIVTSILNKEIPKVIQKFEVSSSGTIAVILICDFAPQCQDHIPLHTVKGFANDLGKAVGFLIAGKKTEAAILIGKVVNALIDNLTLCLVPQILQGPMFGAGFYATRAATEALLRLVKFMRLKNVDKRICTLPDGSEDLDASIAGCKKKFFGSRYGLALPLRA